MIISPLRLLLRSLLPLVLAASAFAAPALGLDPTFSAALPAGVELAEIVAVAPDGSLLVNVRISGETRIVRLLADGSLDTTFAPPATAGRALAYFPDHSVLTERAPYRLASDGASTPLTLPATFDPAQALTGALVLPDGKFLLAQYRQLARFAADGSLDPEFIFANPHQSFVSKLKLDARGRVLVEEGYFLTSSDSLNLAVRLLPDGSEDVSFIPFVGGYRTSIQIFPLAQDDYLVFSTFEGGQNSKVTRLDSFGRAKWSVPYTGLYTGFFAVDSDRFWLYVTGARYRITDEGLGAAELLPINGSNAVVNPDGRLVIRGVNSASPGSPWGIVRLLTGDVYLANLSGRARTGAGENVVIAGLVVGQSGPNPAAEMPALLRGAGPALESLGVKNYLPNPVTDVFDSDGRPIDHNTRWAAALAPTFRTVGAFMFADGSEDAALLHNFPRTRATLFLRNEAGSADGIGLLEIYRVPSAQPTGQLLNLSFRAHTAPGDDTAIAGFVIVDPDNGGRSAKLLLRAVGPTLGSQGIVHPLENPILTLYNSKGEIVAQNDDWSVSPGGNPTASVDLAAAAKNVGAFELTAASKDAALLLDLPAGAYSMHATGGSGVVLLEIYLVR